MRRLVVVLLLVAACAHSSPPPSYITSTTVGGSPCGIAEAAGSVYVSDAASAHLLRLDPTTRRSTVVATLDPTPCELTFAFGALWITTQSGHLDRYDVRSGSLQHVVVGDMSYEAEEAAGALWVSDRNSAQLTRVDPVTLKTSVLPLPGTHPGGLVFAFGALWVGDDTGGSTHLLKVDPVTRTVTPVAAGHRPAYVTATAEAVWVSDVEDGTVSVLDPVSLTSSTLKAGISPVNLDTLNHEVFVPDDTGNAVYELFGSRVVHRYDTPGGPAVVAPVGQHVWVTLFTAGKVLDLKPYSQRPQD